MPLEIVFSRPDTVLAHRLVGATDTDDYERKMHKIFDIYASKQCVEGKEWCECVYRYTELGTIKYFRYPILSVLRGSVVRFYSNGEARQVSFPFAKFFNEGEVRADRLEKYGIVARDTENVDKYAGKNALATEKIDGTLIVVWRDPDTGVLRANTRGRLDVGKRNWFVEIFFGTIERRGMWNDLEELVGDNETVMFELRSSDYPGSTMPFKYVEWSADNIDGCWEKWTPYLLARRRHDTLEIEYYRDSVFDMPVTIDARRFDDVMEFVRTHPEKEGVVLWFPGMRYMDEFVWWDYLVKMKNFAYLLKTVFTGRKPYRKIMKYIGNGRIDDLYPFLPDDMKEFVDTVREKYDKLMEIVNEIRYLYDTADEETRKKIYGVLRRKIWFARDIVTGRLGRMMSVLVKDDNEKTFKAVDRLLRRMKDVYSAVLEVVD